jgi:acetyl/propionyl-CoA carboxylase alpha subunit
MGLEVCAAFSSADGGLPHLRLCDRALELEGDPARVYLDIPKLIDAARKLKADAIHPGYGFLAENEDFAAAVEGAGMTFIGPTPDQIVALGDKVQARKAAQRAGVPTLPGQSEPLANAAAAGAAAQAIGFPILFKAAGGGGGRGMRVVEDPAKVVENFERAQAEAKAAFDDPRIFMEKFIPRARHVEIQILGDGHGKAVWLGERECSVQRRHQKLIEESPAPALPPDAVANMGALAAKLAGSANYRGAGTMEFIVPFGTRDFFFIEMNTRLQVEHPVTELCTGFDLVEEQIAVANGGFSARMASWEKPEQPTPPGPPFSRGGERRGHAIEARIIAEDPEANFRPSCGKMDFVSFPAGPGIRVDAWAEAGLTVSPFYDSLIAKVLAWGNDRAQAIARLDLALRETVIHPIRTTAPFLQRVITGADFRSGQYDTGLLQRVKFEAPAKLPEKAAALCAAGALLQPAQSTAGSRNESRGLSAWQRADLESR